MASTSQKRNGVYTTGFVAKTCCVAPRTVSHWIDSGRLKGYRLPSGTRGRRVPHDALVQFLRANGMPLNGLVDDQHPRVLLVGMPGREADQLREALGETDYRYEIAGSSFEAGVVVESFAPECVAIDFGLGRTEAIEIGRRLQASPHRDAERLALACEDEADLPGLLAVYDWAIRRPFDLADLAARVRARRRAVREAQP